MKVFILGAGKVGTALARGLRAHGDTVTLRAARKGLPKQRIDADIVVLSVREKQLAELSAELGCPCASGRLGRTGRRPSPGDLAASFPPQRRGHHARSRSIRGR